MSIWHAFQSAPERPRTRAHRLTLTDLAIFAGGMLLAVMLGIAATGLIPL